MKHFFLILLLATFFTSCVDSFYEEIGVVDGLVPIYTDPDDLTKIKASGPRTFEDLGGIVERGDFLYFSEKYQGIHVIDNSNPASPVAVAFWEIPGISLFTLDATRLYADNGINLWIIDITDIYNIKVVDFEDEVFNAESNIRPPSNYTGYFECVDFSKGAVVGWKEEKLNNPNCQTL